MSRRKQQCGIQLAEAGAVCVAVYPSAVAPSQLGDREVRRELRADLGHLGGAPQAGGPRI